MEGRNLSAQLQEARGEVVRGLGNLKKNLLS